MVVGTGTDTEFGVIFGMMQDVRHATSYVLVASDLPLSEGL